MSGRHYLDVIMFRTYAELKAEASRTYLGLLWWIIDPILTMMVFYFVFGMIRKPGVENFVQFLLVGVVIWQWFNRTISHAATSLRRNQDLITRVALPKAIFPLTILSIDSFKFSVVFVLLIAFLLQSGFPVSTTYLALPVLLAAQLLLIAGFSFIAAALVPLLPDLHYFIDHALRLLFFLSGIFYSIRQVPAEYQDVFLYNPMALLIDAYRQVLLHQQWPEAGRVALVLAIGLAAVILGQWLLARLSDAYVKAIRA